MSITEPLVRQLLSTVDQGLSRGIGEPIPGKMCVEAAISYALGEPHSDGPSCVDPIVRDAKIVLNDAAWSSPFARAKGMRRVAIAQLGSRDTIDAVKYVSLLSEYVIREIVPIALRWAAKVNPRHASVLEERAAQCERAGNNAAADSAADSAAYAAYAAYAANAAADAAADSAAYSANSAAHSANSAAYAADAAADSAVYSAAYAAADAAYAAANAAYAAAYSAVYSAADAADAAAKAAKAAAERDRILSLCAALMVRALQECHSPGCEWLWVVDETAQGGTND